MAQSLARMYVHLVFSTRYRAPLLDDSLRSDLHTYMQAILQDHGCFVVAINSVDDHIHLLFHLARTKSISEIVEHLKSSSSKWVKTRGNRYRDFFWQAGYGAFSVSERQVEIVKRYIAMQQQHHNRYAYQDEYRALLAEHRIPYDERWVWD
jgi:putative transposase